MVLQPSKGGQFTRSIFQRCHEIKSVEASVGEPDGMGQMIQMEPLVNEEEDCSWSECEQQQNELQQQRSGRFGRSHSIRTSSLNKLNRNSC
jgi:hypothetical protein